MANKLPNSLREPVLLTRKVERFRENRRRGHQRPSQEWQHVETSLVPAVASLAIASKAPVSTRSLGGTPLARAIFLHQGFPHDLSHPLVGSRANVCRKLARRRDHAFAQPTLLLGVLLIAETARRQPIAYETLQDGRD